MRTLLDYWPGWLGLGATFASIAALLAGLSWIPGVGLALRVAIAALEAASPVINGFLSAIIWTWSKVLWPGILDILDSWATILTVLIMGGFLWFGLVARYEAKLISKSYVISKCKEPVREPEPEFNLPWPFSWN